MKIKLVLAYDGSRFCGSATQPHTQSVQDTLAKALAHLGIFEKPLFASRTDKGVHALRAVASVHCGEHFTNLTWLKKKINDFAKPFIYIKNISKVDEGFEPRFHAKAREYRYIFNHGCFDPNLAAYCYFYPQFDISKANALLKLFEGVHDFKYFQKQGGANKSSTRELFKAYAYRHKNLSIFVFRANGFLRSQIRLSTQAILWSLNEKLSQEELLEQIKAKKHHCKSLAPANGLYLSKILY